MTKTKSAQHIKHVDAIGAAREWVDDLKSSLQDDFDRHSEKWQESEKGEAMQERIDALDELYSTLDEAADELSRISEE